MMAWKRLFVPVWSVHNPLWHFIVHIVNTLKSPVDVAHACQHDKQVKTAPLCIHITPFDLRNVFTNLIVQY